MPKVDMPVAKAATDGLGVGRSHKRSGYDCWCDPVLVWICPSCAAQDAPGNGCDACNGTGLRKREHPGQPPLVIHRTGSFSDLQEVSEAIFKGEG